MGLTKKEDGAKFENPGVAALIKILESQWVDAVMGNWDDTTEYTVEKDEGAVDTMWAVHIPPPEDKDRRPDHRGISFYFTGQGELMGILEYENGKPAIS